MLKHIKPDPGGRRSWRFLFFLFDPCKGRAYFRNSHRGASSFPLVSWSCPCKEKRSSLLAAPESRLHSTLLLSCSLVSRDFWVQSLQPGTKWLLPVTHYAVWQRPLGSWRLLFRNEGGACALLCIIGYTGDKRPGLLSLPGPLGLT